MDQVPLTTRFAPSPTGLLHLGHVFSAGQGHALARATGGRFLLRLEDIDQGRCRPEFAGAIAADLAWLGLDWDGPVRRQSDHWDEYQAALDRLAAMGLLYPCFCTRAAIAAEIAQAGQAPHGPDGPLYPGTCRHLDPAVARDRIQAGQPFALRLDMGAAVARTGALNWHDAGAGWVTARPDLFGDVVLARKDVPASYHLAVTWDDAVQGVDVVTRGVDLFAATHVHRLLQSLLDLPTPAYRHHPLLTDADGRRFAKRDRALTVAALRDCGQSPAQVRVRAGLEQSGPG